MKKRSVLQMVSIVIASVFLLASCSSSRKSSSNLKITSIESALSETSLDSIKFSKTKTDEGYTYEARDPSSLCDISYSAVADSKENLSSITITNKDVDTSYLTDGAAFKKLMNTTDFRLSELKAAMCTIQVMQLEKAFGKDTNSMSVNDWISELQPLFQGQKITVEKWTIEAIVNQTSGQVEIKAYYD